MGSLLRRLSRLAFRKGMGGGGRHWLVLGALGWFVGRAREKGKEPPAVYREVLGPGESISLRVFDPPR